MYDPEQAGLAALYARLDAKKDPAAPAAPAPAADAAPVAPARPTLRDAQ